jgi:hypothetical protein
MRLCFLCFFLCTSKERRETGSSKEGKEESLVQVKKEKSPCLLVFLIFKKKKDKM